MAIETTQVTDLVSLVLRFAEQARKATAVSEVFSAFCDEVRTLAYDACLTLWMWDNAKKRACLAHHSNPPSTSGHQKFPAWLPADHDVSRLLQTEISDDCAWLPPDHLVTMKCCRGAKGFGHLKLSTFDDLKLCLIACVPASLDGNFSVHKEFVRLLGRIMVQSIERLRLENERQLLSSISRLAVENETRRAFFESVSKTVAAAFKASGCSIFTYDRSRDLLVLGGTTGLFRRNEETGNNDEFAEEQLLDLTYRHNEGMTGWILTNKQLVRLYDAENSDESIASYGFKPSFKSAEKPKPEKKNEQRACLAAPIFYDAANFVGVIRLHGKTGTSCFLPSDEKKLQSVSAEIGRAIQLWKGISDARDSFLLQESIQQNLRPFDLEKEPALTAITEQAMRLFQACAATVLLRVPDKDELVVARDTRPPIEEAQKIVFSFDKGLCGLAAKSRETVASPDVQNDPRFYDLHDIKPGCVSDVRSEACAPIMFGPLVLGVLNVDSEKIGWFNQNDRRKLSLLERLASQAALVLWRHLDPPKQFNTFTESLFHQFGDDLGVIQTLIVHLEKTYGDGAVQLGEDIKKLKEISVRTTTYWKELGRIRAFDQPIVEPFFVNELIERAKSWLVEGRTSVKSMVVELFLDSNLSRCPLGAQVALDLLIFYQALSEIVTNAVEASAPDGILRITTNLCNGTAIVSIQDFGQGMRSEIVEKLGRIPFSTRGRNGNGLIRAYEMIAQLGGFIHASSPGENQGATFAIHFPTLPRKEDN